MPEPSPAPERTDLERLLIRHLAAGTLPPSDVLPALRAVVGDAPAPPTRAALLRALERQTDPRLDPLQCQLAQQELRDLRRHHVLRRNRRGIPTDLLAELSDYPLDAPLGWRGGKPGLQAVQSLVDARLDRRFIRALRGRAPRIAAVVDQACRDGLKAPSLQLFPWPIFALLQIAAEVEARAEGRPPLLDAIARMKEVIERTRLAQRQAVDAALDRRLPPPTDLDDDAATERLRERFRDAAAAGASGRAFLLDAALTWPTDAVAEILPELCAEPWAQQRAFRVLTLRFGNPEFTTWSDWLRWLRGVQQSREAERARWLPLVRRDPGELLLIWCDAQGGLPAEVVSVLESWRAEQPIPEAPEAFVERWAGDLTRSEADVVLGLGEAHDAAPPPAQAHPPRPAAAPPAAEIPFAEQAPPPARPAEISAAERAPAPPAPPPSEPEGPSVWRDHLRGFFAENWYMVIGLLMVVVGASLLAYFTWDKGWLLRYTIMPTLLAGFTAGLAGIGAWLESKDPRLRGTGALLRGTAIGLLPVNFMAVALLSGDPDVPNPLFAVSAMAAIYLALGGWGLRRWCGKVHPALVTFLAGALLFLNGLVILEPVARVVIAARQDALPLVLGAGFHIGFLVLAGAVLYFTRRILDVEMARERRVPWFVGAALVLTFLEVFAWVHASIHRLPRVHTYGPMVVLAGGLLLSVERRFLELRAESGRHVAESFLGFALILLGALMGASHAQVRVVAFLLAGAVWLRQASRRAHPAHHWIGMTLLVLGGAAAGLLDGFPRPRWPALGIGIALGLEALGAWARARAAGAEDAGRAAAWAMRDEAARGVQGVLLAFTSVVAVLAQWHFRSPPIETAGWLLALAALFAWRAHRDQHLRWVLLAAVLLALALPYLGCVDMEGRSLHGNTMVFGLTVLSVLWLGLTRLRRTPMILDARSAVLWFYGGLAVAGMVLRVIFERGRPGDALWGRAVMDYAGPVAMSAVLGVAAYHARSLVPAGMSAVILIILFPELKARYHETFEQLGWGSGIGSAFIALGLVLACFPLRAWPRLRDLGEGDRFLGREPFPLRRRDYTLFTIPILASAIFLCGKVDTWTLALRWAQGMTVKTPVALGVAGAAWTLLAVYLRGWRGAASLTYLGLGSAFLGFLFGHHVLGDRSNVQWLFALTVVTFQGLVLLYRALQPRRPWVEPLLAAPTRTVLRWGGLALAWVCVLLQFGPREPERFHVLSAVLAVQLVWDGLATRRIVHGVTLFFLGWVHLLNWTAGGTGPLLARLSVESSLSPTLWMVLGIQAVHLALEWHPVCYERLRPLLAPFQGGAVALAVWLGVYGLADGVNGHEIVLGQHGLLLAAVLLAARAQRCAPLALLGMLLAYLLIQFNELWDRARINDRLDQILSPWRLSLLSLAMAALRHGGREAHARAPRLLAGPFGFPSLRLTQPAWIFGPAAAIACAAAFAHTLRPDLREAPVQVWAPYLCAAAMGLTAWSWKRPAVYGLGGVLLTLGNVHAVRVFMGSALRAGGLSENHLVCLGLGATLLQGTAARLALRREAVAVAVNRASLALAGAVLTLLCVNYASHPNLEAIRPLRFVISGAMAWLAGWYFRRAARHPGPGEGPYVAWSEAFYHFGVAMAIWCAALLVPWLRLPSTALVALGLPVLYFYGRAEYGLGRDAASATGARYRSSAAILGFVLLALYVARPVFQMVMFPETRIFTDHYHHNAPVVMALAVVLMRLHALGGTAWLAFYGGLALITGSYFALTSLPGLSPFEAPMPAAWCAVGIAHFWTAASAHRSPLRSWIQALAGIDEKDWLGLRRAWGVCLLAATHVVVGLGLLDYASDTCGVAPLILGAASVAVHQGVLRRSPAYFAVAGIEVALALHAGFVVESHLPPERVVWVLVLLWAAALAAHRALAQRFEMPDLGAVAALMAATCMGHVFYHHPSSTAGLWVAALVALLAALTPRRAAAPEAAEDLFWAGLPLAAPTWLVFFSQAPLQEEGLRGALRAWPVLAAAAALLVTGGAAYLARRHAAGWEGAIDRRRPRLADQTLALLRSHGEILLFAVLWPTTLAAAAVQTTHYGTAFAPREMALLCGLAAALAVAWFHAGAVRRSMVAYVAGELCALGFCAAIRRQLMLTTDLWNIEYDVWASLAASAGLAGFKPVTDRGPRELRVPLLGTLLALPAAALVWTQAHGLGTDVTLVVVGLHSVMFAFLGRDRRDSPYNAVAVVGFVAFALIVFWSKLELRTVQAYVVPVGIGVLALLQLFGRELREGTRNGVRLVTLLAMLGSSGFYALADPRHPIGFNATMLLLCLGAMGLGSLLRIRLYLVLGSAGAVVDLASIVYKTLAGLDRGARMTWVGLLVLGLGAGLVAGAAYYKTHRDAVDGWLGRARNKLGEWE